MVCEKLTYLSVRNLGIVIEKSQRKRNSLYKLARTVARYEEDREKDGEKEVKSLGIIFSFKFYEKMVLTFY